MLERFDFSFSGDYGAEEPTTHMHMSMNGEALTTFDIVEKFSDFLKASGWVFDSIEVHTLAPKQIDDEETS